MNSSTIGKRGRETTLRRDPIIEHGVRRKDKRAAAHFNR
jgi:hypothetical protein